MSDKHNKKRSKRSSKTKRRDDERDDEREDVAGRSDGPGLEDGVGKDGSGSGSDGGLGRSNKNTKKKKSKRSKKDKKHKDKGSARGSGSTGDDDDDAEDNSRSPNAGKGGSKSSRSRSHKDGGKGSGKRSGKRRGLASEDSDDGKAEEDKKEGADAAAKKLADNVNLVKDAKETFAELQARRAVNLARCRLALCLSTLLGVVLVVVGAGLLIAFGFVGRCADADFPYSCGSFECCATSCNATATIIGDEADAATEEPDDTNNNCELVIANPVEISGIVLLLVGWIAVIAALVCFVQVNRVARLDVPASVFGYTLVTSLVLIVLAIIGFIIAALPGSSAGSAAGTTTLQESFLVFALTAVWPGIVLLVVALVGLYTAWKSQATSRKKKILVLGLNGSGKSHVASGIATAAQGQSGRQRRSGGSVQNMGGRSTSGVFVQGVTRSDGYALELLETGDMALSRAVTNTAVQGVNALVFVVDTCDKARLQDAGVFLEQIYALPDFWGLPLLVVGNKSGRWDAVTAQSLVNALNLHVVRDRHWYFVACSATRDSSKSFRDALEWLCDELEIPVELQVQHPNFIASAFPCVPSESTQSNGEGRVRPPPALVQAAAGAVGSSAAEGKTGRAEAKSSSSETKLAEAV